METVIRQHRSKADLLEAMRAERARLDALFDRIPEPRWELPGAMGAWTVKDMLAHLLCYETWIAAQVDPTQRASLPTEVINDHMGETEERNQVYYQLYKDRPVREVRAEARQVFERLLAAVENVSEEALNIPMAFDADNNINPTTWDAPPEPLLWPLWKWVSYESYEHYPDHIPDLEAWAAAG